MAWGGGNANSVDAWVKRLTENDASFTSLHILSFRRVTSAELGRVFEALEQNSTLKELYASGHSLDEEATQKLSQSLIRNTTLERLNIGSDLIGTRFGVMRVLMEGLAQNKGLVKLDLENKGLGGLQEEGASSDAGIASVSSLARALEKNETLRELNLARNKLTDKDISVLCTALAKNKTLQKIDLCLNSFNRDGTQAVADLLSGQDQLLEGDHLGLREIDLSDNDITEEGGIAIGRALATNKVLQRLRMSSCMDPPLPVEEDDEDKIPLDDEIQSLNKVLSKDQEADIVSDGDAVVGAIAESLKVNSTLQEIWMDFCNISSIGANRLAQALRQNKGLLTLRMRNNRVGNRGARAIGAALTPASGSAGHDGENNSSEKSLIRHNTTLINLELGSNKIGVLGWHGLVGASSLESLGLYENQVNVLHEALESHLHNAGESSSSIPALSATIPNGTSSSHQILESLVHLDIGVNGISRDSFTQLGECLIKGMLPALIRLEIAGNGDRSEAAPEVPDDNDEPEEPEEDPDQDPGQSEEQAAWEQIVTRIEEARPTLAIHWKGAGAMQQQQS
ncbi:Leucine-rich repeat-containing protein 34 [Gryganskiella cystojenkinii]|nr:Leucine-rich repeat-containing protein 34 [Gryganskiella cystojenkinii]